MAKRKIVPKIRRISDSDLLKETKEQLKEVERRLRKLEKGIDVNRGVYNPKTKRYERKGTYKVITEMGEVKTMKPTKRVKYSVDSWAGKKLQEKLSTVGDFNIKKLKLPKNMSSADLKAVNKAFSNFLKSQTSTIKGIKGVEKSTKSSIKDLVSDIDNIDNSDIETLYSFFGDKDFNYVTQYVDPSELMILLAETREDGGSSDDFLRKIENYIDKDSLYQDEDMVDALERVYDKF